MRIIVCTKRDLHGCAILNRLLPALVGHELFVILSDKTRPAEDAVPELAQLKLLERDLPLRLLFPLIDRQPASGASLTFDGLARRHGVGMRVVRSVNDGDDAGVMRAFRPDLMVAARFSLIFKPLMLALPPLGIYNIHPGELPRYGGLFAPMRALVAGDARLGCTVHRMDEGIDTGPIYGVARLEARRDRSLFWHTRRLYPLGLALFLELLGKLERGEPIVLEAQDHTRREYRSLPTTRDFADYRASGGWLVTPDEYIERLAGYLPSAATDPAAAGFPHASG